MALDFFPLNYFATGYFPLGYFPEFQQPTDVPIAYTFSWDTQTLFVVGDDGPLRATITRPDGGMVNAPDLSQSWFKSLDFSTGALILTFVPILEGDGSPSSSQTLSCRYTGGMPKSALKVRYLATIGNDLAIGETLIIAND